jgi:glyoxylase I family protein
MIALVTVCASTFISTSVALASPNKKQPLHPPFQLKRLDHVVLRCRNFQPMFDFYTNILGCTVDDPILENVGRFGGALTHLRAGEQTMIDLLSYDTTHLTQEGEEAVIIMHGGGKGIHDNDSRMGVSEILLSSSQSTLDHLCLLVDPFDETKIVDYLQANGIDIFASGQRKGAEGVGPSVYFEDPEGNVIELKGPVGQKSSMSAASAFTTNQLASKSITTIASSNVISGESSEVKCIDDREDISLQSEQEQENQNQASWVSITPCVRICRYNADFYGGQVCIGCFREGFEIGAWSSMSDAERSMTLLDAADRCPDASKAGEWVLEGSVSKEELLRQSRFWSQRGGSQQ